MGAVARQLLAGTAALVLLCGCTSDTEPSGGRIPVDAPVPAARDQDACRELREALPARVADQETRPVEPASDWASAWGDPAIVLTCGGPPAQGFRRISTCTTVNGVDWFIPEEQLEAREPVDLTMTTVNRRPVVEVLLPAAHWPPATTLADLATSIRRSTEKTGSCV